MTWLIMVVDKRMCTLSSSYAYESDCDGSLSSKNCDNPVDLLLRILVGRHCVAYQRNMESTAQNTCTLQSGPNFAFRRIESESRLDFSFGDAQPFSQLFSFLSTFGHPSRAITQHLEISIDACVLVILCFRADSRTTWFYTSTCIIVLHYVQNLVIPLKLYFLCVFGSSSLLLSFLLLRLVLLVYQSPHHPAQDTLSDPRNYVLARKTKSERLIVFKIVRITWFWGQQQRAFSSTSC